MADRYVYLISSLPSLSFGAKPPFTFAGFLKTCEGLVSKEDMEVVRSAGDLISGPAAAKNGALKVWKSFETMLRNELVAVRAARKKIDPAKYLREDGYPESSYAAYMAINAGRKPSLIEAEKSLDLDRWHQLDEFAIGHYFDTDILVIYACKLLILEKWDKIGSADSGKLLEEALKL
ncbi:MAG: DUF2764 family protein [Candidatus Omnitrophota bacterium]